MSAPFHDYGLKCDQAPAVTKSLRYEAPINVTLGNLFQGACSVGAFTYINAHGSFSETSFGRYCSVAEWVCTGPGQHPTHALSTHPFACDPHNDAAGLNLVPAYRAIHATRTFAPNPTSTPRSPQIVIGNDVWIGMRTVIMNGVTVGDGAVIGAGSIVTRDVPPYAIVAGVPARVIRYRFPAALVERLLALRWWDYDMAQVTNKVDYGQTEAVVDFMAERIAAGQLSRFTAKRYELKQNGPNYSVGPLPPAQVA